MLKHSAKPRKVKSTPPTFVANPAEYQALDYLTHITVNVPVDIFGKLAPVMVHPTWFTKYSGLDASEYFALAVSCGAYLMHEDGPSKGVFTVRKMIDLPPHVLEALTIMEVGGVQ